MDKLLLRLFSVFVPMLAKSGVDTYQLYEIVKIKLLMDSRRPNMMFMARKSSNTTTTAPWRVLLVNLIMGGLIGMVLIISEKPMVGQTAYFFVFMVLMSLTLITDFTTVLLDVRDQYIILPKPVNDRTLAVSRILHITIYVLKQALLISVGGLIFVGFLDGIVAVPLFIVQVLEATLLSILLVNIVYLLAMKSVSPQRFKDIISYFQIGFSIVIFGIYYLLPRLIDVSALKQIDLTHYWWSYLLPPVWIAALNEVLIHPARAGIVTSLLAIAGVTAPIVSLWLIAKVLAPGFNQQLMVSASADNNSTAAVPAAGTKKQRFSIVNYLANLVARDPVENAGFRITWKLAARIREFKIKVYPAFAYVPIYFVYFTFQGKGDTLSERYAHLQHGRAYILLIYLSTFVLSAVLQNISFSEKYKPAWIYYALPITQPGKILSGMYKAIAILYYLPYCLVLGIVGVAIWGPQIINDIILAFFAGLIYGLLMALFMVKGLPFSKPVLNRQGGGRAVTSLIITSLVWLIGFGHYLLMKWETVIWILIVPVVLIYWIMMYYYKRQTWEGIELEEF
ncbi:hypothetical protein HH214_11250 [Mucilaginibacter robiniae]|uniref:Uncharacterized protein n=1 Tax=Mucilaginibacter robiniae TaxID=2728022 RepID=A0A7L5DZ66_9SPHI|nr:hypothetical protein [Mucilaginibacter robiniae]QJD96402.1 hypothetical protein HH214_11250 [Mucilaginibacter robiniae]